jgi:hypothetical protein
MVADGRRAGGALGELPTQFNFASKAIVMGCAKCELRADLDGRDVHVRLWYDHLHELGWSDSRNSLLYQCSACLSLWEMCAYHKAAEPIALDDARIHFPAAAIQSSSEPYRP